jgi:transcriptional regulator of acetoin/glycerol metabolism
VLTAGVRRQRQDGAKEAACKPGVVVTSSIASSVRDRVEDVFAIARVLVHARRIRLDIGGADVEAVERLMLHTWPTNVRELTSTLERVARSSRTGTLTLDAVEHALGPLSSTGSARTPLTEESVEHAVAHAGSESAAAKALGVTRGKLRRFRETYRKV